MAMTQNQDPMDVSLHDTDGSGEHQVRIQKVVDMQKEGIDPWPSYKPVSHTCSVALEEFPEFEDGSKEYILAGRLMSMREHGKTIFAHIQDRSGRIQLYIKQDIVGDKTFDIIKKYIDMGDIIWVRGALFKTKTGEITLKVLECTLLSKCLHPLPDKFHGLTDVEHRYRARYLDLMTNEETRDRFKKRSQILHWVRTFLLNHDFLEVETPMLHPIPGGAAARPFVTHHNAYDMELFLRIAPELYLKRLVIGGFERVFEINRNFRNEGVSTRHNPEFTMLEFYMAHGDYRVGMDLTEQLLHEIVQHIFGTSDVVFQGKTLSFKPPFKRLTVTEALIEFGGFTQEQLTPETIDQILIERKLTMPAGQTSYGEKLFFLFEEFVEKLIVQPTFVIGYPIEVSPLAKRDAYNPAFTARFELFIHGMELSNGFSELNDPFDQAERFRKQAASGDAGNIEAHRYDEDYINALEYGLPPTIGVGIGIDRLVMFLTDTPAIKDVILFPTMKHAKHE